ncbi:MAG: hypothetical protein ACTSVY_13120 [Candidatus Helarchaeota archaeon]
MQLMILQHALIIGFLISILISGYTFYQNREKLSEKATFGLLGVMFGLHLLCGILFYYLIYYTL